MSKKLFAEDVEENGSTGLDNFCKQRADGYYNEPDDSFVGKVTKIIKKITGIEPLLKNYCGAYLPVKKSQCLQGKKYGVPFAQADEFDNDVFMKEIEFVTGWTKEFLDNRNQKSC